MKVMSSFIHLDVISFFCGTYFEGWLLLDWKKETFLIYCVRFWV